ncbi:MAG: hypothetical protein N3A63_02905 [Bacteroidetes bacterium]|nr:hypothetical protein [Bacteroidota bacterium]
MVKRIISFILLFLLFNTLFLSLGIALDPQKKITQYVLDHWNKGNGLPANSINQCLQTRDGFLWLGTSVGLYRFDGVAFDAVGTYPGKEEVTESITTLCEARDSNLWVGTTYSGVRLIKQGKVQIFGNDIGFNEPGIRVILESKDGSIWIGTENGLFVLTKNKKLQSIYFDQNYITALAEDHEGNIWVGLHGSIRIIKQVNPLQYRTLTMKDGLPHYITTTLYCDRKGTIWIGTVYGLLEWNNGPKRLFSNINGLSDFNITAITEDRDGNLWVGTNRGGVNRYSNGRWSALTVFDGLTSNRILSLYEDQEGSLWIGTVEGLNRLKEGSVVPYTVKEGLASELITSIIEGYDKSLYLFSNFTGHIQRIREGKISIYNALVGPTYLARDGSIWIGQTGRLTCFKGNDVMTVYDTKDGLPLKWISAITEDEESIILYIDDIGIHRFKKGKLIPFYTNDSIPYFSDSYVTSFYYQKAESTLWITRADGLVRVKHGISKIFTVKDGLAGNWISSVADDKKGTLWFTSPRDGLTRYRNGVFTKYTAKDGLFTNELYCAVCDDSGDVWLSSPRGIGYLQQRIVEQFDAGTIEKITMRVFTTADGMKSEECFGGSWQPSAWKASDGSLWFSTVKGAVQIHPRKLRTNTIPPNVHIHKVIADGHIYSTFDSLILQPGTDRIEILYSATSYLVPERVRFKYRLEGYDTDWIDAKTRRAAYYTNLPPKDYTFRVIACNNDGVWNTEGASIILSIQPHFYQTTWFLIFVLLTSGCLLYGVYRLRVWQLHEREKELQQRVQEELANVKMLSGLIPICSVCKKIRNDKGYWDQLEAYIQTHSEAKFSHGICPECAASVYGEYYKSVESKQPDKNS